MSQITTMTDAQRRFLLHWGEMGSRWGINRSVAQIHALLYLAAEPIDAATIAETLDIARSNVSTCLRELQGWGLVRVVREIGDRRDRFEALHDVWALFAAIVEERKRREIDPTIDTLRQAVDEATRDGDETTRQRLAELLAFFETTSAWYDAIRRLPQPTLRRFFELGEALPKKLGLKQP